MKCKVCGERLRLDKECRYEVVKVPDTMGVLLGCKREVFEAFDCSKCGCQNIVNVKEVSTGILKNSKEIKSASGLIDFIKNYVDIEYEYNPCVKRDIPVVNLDRVVELINEYCESEDEV